MKRGEMMDRAELDKTLELHKKWLLDEPDGKRADLREADLCGADLRWANLRDAILCGANLRGAKNIPYIPLACPDSGAFIGWKKAVDFIVKLQIPEDAKRSSATGRKCRCDKAIVLEVQNMDGTPSETGYCISQHDNNFEYRVGQTVCVDNFCEDRFSECAGGIHFFINRQEAVEYDWW